MPMQKPTKPGSTMITQVGHTVSNHFGITPDAKVVGRSTEPTPQKWGK